MHLYALNLIQKKFCQSVNVFLLEISSLYIAIFFILCNISLRVYLLPLSFLHLLNICYIYFTSDLRHYWASPLILGRNHSNKNQ